MDYIENFLYYPIAFQETNNQNNIHEYMVNRDTPRLEILTMVLHILAY